MITNGFWCDECRCKYVQHACKTSLPCEHPKQNAIFVYAKYYSRGQSESIIIEGCNHYLEIELDHTPLVPNGHLAVKQAKYLWFTYLTVTTKSGTETEMSVGEFIHKYPAIIVRAFEDRWQSTKIPPDVAWIKSMTTDQLDLACDKITLEEFEQRRESAQNPNNQNNHQTQDNAKLAIQTEAK